MVVFLLIGTGTCYVCCCECVGVGVCLCESVGVDVAVAVVVVVVHLMSFSTGCPSHLLHLADVVTLHAHGALVAWPRGFLAFSPRVHPFIFVAHTVQ